MNLCGKTFAILNQGFDAPYQISTWREPSEMTSWFGDLKQSNQAGKTFAGISLLRRLFGQPFSDRYNLRLQ
jgi:hypothetical protein